MKASHILLIAALIIGVAGIVPVSAELTTVAEGGAVFVGEEGLTFAGSPAGTTICWFAPGDNPMTDAPSATYICQGAGNEVISPATFQTRTGNWYLEGTSTVAINVLMPAIDVRVYNSATNNEMTNGKAIKEGTSTTFRLDSNLYEGIISRPYYGAGDATGIKVVVVDPDSTTYTALYNDETRNTSYLTNLFPTTVQYYLPGNSVAPTTLAPNWYLDLPDYPTGTYTFYAQVNLNNLQNNLGTVAGVTKSEVKTLDIAKDFVNIDSNKNSIIRNNDFSVTITGRPDEYYVLWVAGTSNISAPDTVPYIKANQNGVIIADVIAGAYTFDGTTTVASDVCQVAPASGSYYARVKLSDSGSRTVGFSTDATTNIQTYTIRTDYYSGVAPAAEDILSNTTEVTVEKGDVTINASGKTTFAMGEEIVLSGVNSDSDGTWLFMTGPNLRSSGAPLSDPTDGVVTGGSLNSNPVPGSWTPENVGADNTWEFKWNTKGISLSTGTYTIYAVNTPTNNDDLEPCDAIYDTLTLTLTAPQLTLSMPRHSYTPGETIHINGTAGGTPTAGVATWILGDNYWYRSSESVSETGSYACELNSYSMGEGQYTVFVQHPMENDMFDIATMYNFPCAGQISVTRPILDPFAPLFILSGPGSLKYPAVADALEAELSAPAIDDTYIRDEFIIGTPWITVDPIADHNQGDTIEITGTSNLPAGEEITFSGGMAGTGASALYGNTRIVDGGGLNNTWTFSLDTTGFFAGTYNLSIVSTDIEAEEDTQFTLLKQEPSTITITRPLSQGWNLISVPVNNATIRSEGALYPTAFFYDTGTAEYQSVSLAALSAGTGYWVGAYADTNITYAGNALNELSMPASDGWNMLGTLSMETSASSLQPNAGIITSVYAYNPEQRIYFAPGILTPGSGNWVDATEACTIDLTTTPPEGPA